MKKLTTNIIVFLSVLLLNNCGFQVMKKEGLKDINFVEINTKGENRINYEIKNNILLFSNKNANNLVKISLDTKKTKSIKEKNDKNEIVKYQLDVSATVNYNIPGKLETKSFVVKKSGDYKVGIRHVQTLSNEKKLMEIIKKGISEEIIEKLDRRLSDL